MSGLIDLQLEGLVGPTHNYAGLSFGNVASTTHALQASYPQAAALQSLEKMKLLDELGVPVAVMPPHPRPALDVLSRLGYNGTPEEQIAQTANQSPELLANIYSASAMWCANAATVAPSCDTADGKVHFTPANLLSSLHRAIEARTTTHILRQLFADHERFVIHDALPVTTRLADEGAANHMRLCGRDVTKGTHLFIYGAGGDSALHPARFPARQQFAASTAIAKLHQLPADHVFYLQQNPDAIDSGVFHNDVIAMSHNQFLCYHEGAYSGAGAELAKITRMLEGLSLRIIQESELSMNNAVQTYFFNAQIVSLPDGGMCILFPQETAENPQAHHLAQNLLAEDNPVTAIRFLNLRESMRNGGGPACLRLRVPLTQDELHAMHQPARYSAALHEQLGNLITSHYPETLYPQELANPELMIRSLETQQRILTLLQLA